MPKSAFDELIPSISETPGGARSYKLAVNRNRKGTDTIIAARVCNGIHSRHLLLTINKIPESRPFYFRSRKLRSRDRGQAPPNFSRFSFKYLYTSCICSLCAAC